MPRCAAISGSRYAPYGELVAQGGAGVPSPWAYRGALDLSPGSDPLYDIGARLYAPSLAAWTSADTVAGSVADPLSLNRYLYALANTAVELAASVRLTKQAADARFLDPRDVAIARELARPDAYLEAERLGPSLCEQDPARCAGFLSAGVSCLGACAPVLEAGVQGAAAIGTAVIGGATGLLDKLRGTPPPIVTGPTAEGAIAAASKQEARQLIQQLAVSPEQLASALRGVNAVGSSASISVQRTGDSLLLFLTRPGANGWSTITKVIGPRGTDLVVHTAYTSEAFWTTSIRNDDYC